MFFHIISKEFLGLWKSVDVLMVLGMPPDCFLMVFYKFIKPPTICENTKSLYCRADFRLKTRILKHAYI